MSRRPRREAALVLAGFAALAVLWTWPLAPRPRTTMAAPFGDPLLNSWIGRIRALWSVLGPCRPPPLKESVRVRCETNVWRVLSANSPTGCSAKSACHGSRLRARRGVPSRPPARTLIQGPLTTRLAVFPDSVLARTQRAPAAEPMYGGLADQRTLPDWKAIPPRQVRGQREWGAEPRQAARPSTCEFNIHNRPPRTAPHQRARAGLRTIHRPYWFAASAANASGCLQTALSAV